MRVNKQQLDTMLSDALAAVGYELVGAELASQGKHSILRVYIDSENGINIDDCEKASRQISAVLDVEDPIAGVYRLEVSSPGIERPLFTLAHYQRFVGKKVKLMLSQPLQERRNFTGIIAEINDDKVTLCVDEENFVFEFNNISKAHLIA